MLSLPLRYADFVVGACGGLEGLTSQHCLNTPKRSRWTIISWSSLVQLMSLILTLRHICCNYKWNGEIRLLLLLASYFNNMHLGGHHVHVSFPATGTWHASNPALSHNHSQRICTHSWLSQYRMPPSLWGSSKPARTSTSATLLGVTQGVEILKDFL